MLPTDSSGRYCDRYRFTNKSRPMAICLNISSSAIRFTVTAMHGR